MKISAFDLSLVETGFAIQNGGPFQVGTLKSSSRGMQRLAWIRDRVLFHAKGSNLVLVEGYSYASANQAHQLGELGGVIRLALYEAGLQTVELQPSKIKKLATGKGNAKKPDMLGAAIRRLDYGGSNDNEVDALWLLEAALQHFGLSRVQLPAVHLEALKDIPWPSQPSEPVAIPRHRLAGHGF